MSGTSADLQQRAVRGPVGGEGGEGHRVQADGGAPQQEHDVLRAGGPVLRKEAHHPAHPATQRGEGGGAKTANPASWVFAIGWIGCQSGTTIPWPLFPPCGIA